MPINLRYGQQAVARGFVSSKRLQQVLAKQRQLQEQGKKVSVRMILEKAKLLTPEQLAQLDRDLNIKVVKRKTGTIERPGVPPAGQPAGAQDFAGDVAVPQFPGMAGGPDPDATVFSPPPPEMQEKIREERERARAEALARQEAEAASALDEPAITADPFAQSDAMAPEPFAQSDAMAPEPFAQSDDMAPEPFAQSDAMAPEPFAEAPMAPEPFGQPELQDAPAELERMDSSPKLQSLAAEFDGISSPDDEELPVVEAGDKGLPPAQPLEAGLQPAADGFGDDFAQQPMEMGMPEAGTAPLGGPEPAAQEPWGEAAPAAASFDEQGGGDLDQTVFSPPPPGLGQEAPMAAPEPAADAWGEEAPAAPSFDDAPAPAEVSQDHTLFSPTPPGVGGVGGLPDFPADPLAAGGPAPAAPAAQPPAPAPVGRMGADDFSDVEVPVAKALDDQPTAPATGDAVHPLRRGIPMEAPVEEPVQELADEPEEAPAEEELPIPSDEVVSEEFPDEEPLDDEPLDEEPLEEELVAPGPKLPGKGLPVKGLPGKAGTGTVHVPSDEEMLEDEVEEPKKKSKRVLLFFVFLLFVLLAVLIVPVALPPGTNKYVDRLRNHPRAKPYYNHVEKIYEKLLDWTGILKKDLPQKVAPDDQPGNQPGEGANAPGGAGNGEGG